MEVLLVNSKRLIIYLALAVVGFALFTYSGSFNNEFIWDDPIVIDRQLPFFDSFSSVFAPPGGIPQFGGHYYRPLIVASYLVDDGVAKMVAGSERAAARRVVFHASPVICHMCVSLMVFLLGLRLLSWETFPGLEEQLAAAAAALLFAVHPIHVESVAWMAGRSDVLLGLFVLGAVLTFLQYLSRPQKLWLGLTALLTLGACLTKESGMGLFLLLPLLRWLAPEAGTLPAPEPAALSRADRRRIKDQKNRSPRPQTARLLGLELGAAVLVLLVYFALRKVGLHNEGDAVAQFASPAFHRAPRFSLLPGAVGWYLVKTIWPFPQSSFVTEIPGPAYSVLGVAALLAAAGVGFWALRRRRGLPEVAAMVLFFTTLALSLSVVVFPISETMLAERYLYLPSAGVLLLAVFSGLRLQRRLLRVEWMKLGKGLVAAFAVLLAVPLALAAFNRVEVWSTNRAFWEDTVKKSPEEGIPHLHLGITLAEAGKHEEAIKEYQLALRYYRKSEGKAKAHNNLGSMYLRVGRYEEAIGEFKAALQEESNYETPYYNWALTLVQLADEMQDKQKTAADPAAIKKQRSALYQEAREKFEKALSINKRYVKCFLNYGSFLLRFGQKDLALEMLQQAADLAPASREGAEARRMIQQIRR